MVKSICLLAHFSSYSCLKCWVGWIRMCGSFRLLVTNVRTKSRISWLVFAYCSMYHCILQVPTNNMHVCNFELEITDQVCIVVFTDKHINKYTLHMQGHSFACSLTSFGWERLGWWLAIPVCFITITTYLGILPVGVWFTASIDLPSYIVYPCR